MPLFTPAWKRSGSQFLGPSKRASIKTLHTKASFASNTAKASGNPPPTKIIFSGIQPTGVPHLGNYLGALRHWVRLQDETHSERTRLLYSLVDLHAITVRQDPVQLRRWRKESLAMLMAIGLDPKKSIIFYQSDVPAHAMLMWVLSCQASTGYLDRMTQWKDKTSNEKEGSERLKLGLFSYPVLQAADILVHGATHVPVGDDQAQHLEFARELANGFNHLHGADILTSPRTIVSPAKRIMSLLEPRSKMSKSHENPNSRILLTDTKEIIQAKLKAAVTDSLPGIEYRPEERPGVSNILDIIHHSEMASSTPHASAGDQEALAKDMADLSLRALKERAADVVDSLISPIRERYAEFMGDEDRLNGVAREGAVRARDSAHVKLARVKEAIGIDPTWSPAR